MQTYDDFSRKHKPRAASDRSFGLVFAAALTLYGLRLAVSGQAIRLWIMFLAGACLLIALLRPSLLHPLNRIWFQFGLLLGRIVNPITTAVIFYAVITPMALLARWCAKDPLRLRFDTSAPSYWLERRPPGPPPKTMVNQF